NDAITFIKALNDNAASGLKDTFGGPVRFAIPEAAAWKKAGDKQTNNKGGHSFAPSNIGSRRYGKATSSKPKWYKGLSRVDDDEVGPFMHLSGNASEIVSLGFGRFGLKGGSLLDTSGKGKPKWLDVWEKPASLGSGAVKLFSGLRLAIVPTR
ncbi:MAG: hypothetical protein ACI97A_002014, partial [Planctomycetota bacterium]